MLFYQKITLFCSFQNLQQIQNKQKTLILPLLIMNPLHGLMLFEDSRVFYESNHLSKRILDAVTAFKLV